MNRVGAAHMKIRLLALVILGVSTVAVASAAPAPGKAPRFAPGFDLPTRDRTVSSDSLRGQLVYVDFWASWCAPCRKSFPWLRELHDRYAARGLVIVAVNLDKKREAAEAFLQANPAPFTVAFDPTGRTAEAFRVKVMPSSFLVSPTGEIISEIAGFDAGHQGAVEALVRQWCAK
jgi:cytochrome c biogenesis protein CcmG, thiol:disulfide interchange protein DsbE